MKRAPRYALKYANCAQMGRHFFVRDYVLGVFPVGRPYCMWCGSEKT